METTRKTGLGDSLLLRRTEAPSAVTPTVIPDAQVPAGVSTPEPTPSEPATVEAESVLPPPDSKLPRKVPLVLRDRCTLYLDRAVNEQLHMAARIEGRERSEVVTDILRKHLPKYRIELQE